MDTTQPNLSWNDYFMMSAILASKRSKDPCTKVGCTIVNKENRIVSSGYNGFPNGIDDSKLPWTKDSKIFSETKYAYVVHAEVNSILNSLTTDLNGCTLYTTLFPCCECTKLIIQKGINKIVYINKSNNHKESLKASEIMLELANITSCKYNGIEKLTL